MEFERVCWGTNPLSSQMAIRLNKASIKIQSLPLLIGSDRDRLFRFQFHLPRNFPSFLGSCRNPSFVLALLLAGSFPLVVLLLLLPHPAARMILECTHDRSPLSSAQSLLWLPPSPQGSQSPSFGGYRALLAWPGASLHTSCTQQPPLRWLSPVQTALPQVSHGSGHPRP